MNDLVVQQSSDITPVEGETTVVSWTPPSDLTWEQFEHIGNTFQQIKQSLSWWLGDWFQAGTELFEESVYQAVPESGKSYETLLKFRAVAFRVPKEIRRADLSWTHHFYVAYNTPDEQRGPLLDLAANIGLSSRELKDVVKLDVDVRWDILQAVENYTSEEGPMTRDTFFALVNRFKLDTIDRPEPKEEDDDEEDEEDTEESLPFDDTGEDEPVIAFNADDVTDFWENAGVPLTSVGPSQAVWEGIVCYAAVNANGQAVLIWEQTP